MGAVWVGEQAARSIFNFDASVSTPSERHNVADDRRRRSVDAVICAQRLGGVVLRRHFNRLIVRNGRPIRLIQTLTRRPMGGWATSASFCQSCEGPCGSDPHLESRIG